MTDGQLEQDAGDMPQRGDAVEELMYDVGYHRNRLKLVAIDAILQRVSSETLRWLQGGPRPRRSIPLSNLIFNILGGWRPLKIILCILT